MSTTSLAATRFERGVDLADEDRIQDLGEDMFRVWGNRPVPYLVDFAACVCSCPDWQRNHERVGYCKHLHSIALRIRRRRGGGRRRQSPARLVKLEAGESLRGVLADPEALDRVAARLGV